MALWPRQSRENKFVFERDLLDFQTNPRIFRALQRSLFCALPCDLVGKCATAGGFEEWPKPEGPKGLFTVAVASRGRAQFALAPFAPPSPSLEPLLLRSNPLQDTLSLPN